MKPLRYQPLTLAVLSATTLLNLAYADPSKNKNAADLATTVVTASGYEQNLRDAPATISVITSEELKGKAYYDVTDALRDIPGVSVEGGGSSNGRGMGGFKISIRGMPNEYSLLLIDGKPQGNSGQVFYNGNGDSQETGWLPPIAAIERIEVIRGPMSSLYGSQAIGGVVNIITKKVLNDFSGTVSAQRIIQENSKSGDSQLYNFYLTGPIISDRLGFSLDGNFSQRDEDKIERGNMDNERQNINAKLNWIVNEKNNLSLEYGHFLQESSGKKENIGFDIDLREIKKEVYGVTHEYAWTDAISTRTFVTREEMSNKFQNGGTKYIQSIANTKTVIPMETNTLTLGAEYKKEETDHGTRGLNIKKLDRWSGAFFLEDEYFVTDDFMLTAGMRWNQDEKYGGEFTPRLYGVYHLNDNFTVKGGVSTGYVTPNLKQGDSAWVEGGFGARTDGADIGNDDLKPEKSTNYEVGLVYDNLENLNLSMTLYQTYFSNKIQKSTICDRRASSNTGDLSCIYLGYDYEAIAKYNNADKAELKGFELSSSLDVLDNLRLTANYTFSDSEITKGKGKGDPLNNYPKHMFNIGADYQALDDLKMWAKARYRGKTLEEGDQRVPAYVMADLGANYNVTSQLSVNLGVYNFLDKEIKYEKYGKVLDGRRYALGIRYDF
ncbi:TonB-dependent receptor [Pseudomonas sp. F1_0610]|uniref:TonB-dependent receptor domain-containing protein n=1 Tax=Pseudomonas sp. F1_0610 TaxID=3114284 RepID=UPI0039C19F57